MTPLWLELAALALYGPPLILFHEAGHAALARLGGYRVTSFAVGVGRPIWTLALSNGTVVHLNLWLMAGGSCTAIPLGPATARRGWFHGGGLLFQAVLALVLLALPDHWLVERLWSFNLLVALTNVVPWRMRGAASDGWYLWHTLRGRGSGGLLAQRPALDRLATAQSRVGALLGQSYAELCLAWTDVLAGRAEHATAFFARPVPPGLAGEPWLDALYHHVRASWHRALGRPLAALGEVRAVRWYRGDQLADAANDLLTLCEATALLDLGEFASARQLLGRLAGVGGVAHQEATALLLWADLAEPAPGPHQLVTARRVRRRASQTWMDPGLVIELLWWAAEVLPEPTESQRCRVASRRLARRTLASSPAPVRADLARRLGEAAGVRTPSGLASRR